MRRRAALFLVLSSPACTLVAGLEALRFEADGSGGSTSSTGGSGGCAADLMNDVDNCGSCEHVCPAGPNEAAACVDGTCTLACESGRGDCDGMAETGCETDLANDADHCGSCHFDCLGQACQAGICPIAVLAGGQDSPYDIEASGTDVYWINSDSGTIMRCAASGCPGGPTALGVSGGGSYFLAVDGAHVFWNNNAADQIWKCSVDGCLGSEELLFSTLNPTQVGVDASRVCWHANTGDLHCGNKDGGDLQLVIGGQASHGDIQPRGDTLYWTTSSIGDVRRCALADCPGTEEILVTNLSGIWAFEFDAEYVYVASNSGTDDVLARFRMADPTDYQELATGQQAIRGITLRDGFLYWPNGVPDGTVRRVPAAGGTVETIATKLNEPRDVSVAAGYAFVTVNKDGLVYRIPLPR